MGLWFWTENFLWSCRIEVLLKQFLPWFLTGKKMLMCVFLFLCKLDWTGASKIKRLHSKQHLLSHMSAQVSRLPTYVIVRKQTELFLFVKYLWHVYVLTVRIVPPILYWSTVHYLTFCNQKLFKCDVLLILILQDSTKIYIFFNCHFMITDSLFGFSTPSLNI